MMAWQAQAAQVQAIVQENAKLQQQFETAIERLREDASHDYRIDVEADSTIAADEMSEKMGRVEFLQQMVPMLEQVVPIAQGNPPLAALAKEMVMFAVRGFRVARSLEETFEAAFDAIAKMPPHPSTQPDKGKPGVDPRIEAAKIQAGAQGKQAEIAQKDKQATMMAGIKAQQVAGTIANQTQEIQDRAAYDAQRVALAERKQQSADAWHGVETAHLIATDGKDLT